MPVFRVEKTNSYTVMSNHHLRNTDLTLKANGTIILTSDLMNELDLCIGTELLSIRSSDIAFTMGAKGPLLEKAHNYTGKIQRY